MTERKKIEIEWSPSESDWCATVPTKQGAHMGHGRTPGLALQKALQKALRMAGASAFESASREHARDCPYTIRGAECTCGAER